jgi:Sec7-like guanine-nucleotide exchange factor
MEHKRFVQNMKVHATHQEFLCPLTGETVCHSNNDDTNIIKTSDPGKRNYSDAASNKVARPVSSLHCSYSSLRTNKASSCLHICSVSPLFSSSLFAYSCHLLLQYAPKYNVHFFLKKTYISVKANGEILDKYLTEHDRSNEQYILSKAH